MTRDWNLHNRALPPSKRYFQNSANDTNSEGRRLHQRRMTSHGRGRGSLRGRRSRSPRRRRSFSTSPKRLVSRGEKRIASPNFLINSRTSSKKNSRNRSKSPPLPRPPPPKATSKDHHTHSVIKHELSDGLGGSAEIGDHEKRFSSEEKYVVGKPLFRDPEKDVLSDHESLKKIVVNLRGIPSGPDSIKRNIINPEDITVVRRAGEGSRPIFERDEIVNHARKHEEERDRRTPTHLGRKHIDSDFSSEPRSREYINERRKSYSNLRPSSREFESQGVDRRNDRDEDRRANSRTRTRSHDRSRPYSPERRERYRRNERRSYRRSLERGRSEERLLRRRISPEESRRYFGEPRTSERRERSLDKFSGSDYPHGYYEVEEQEAPMPPPGRGRARGLAFRGRGKPPGTFVRPAEIIMPHVRPIRPILPPFVHPVPGMGMRMLFRPRLMAPIGRHLMRVTPLLPF